MNKIILYITFYSDFALNYTKTMDLLRLNVTPFIK